MDRRGFFRSIVGLGAVVASGLMLEVLPVYQRPCRTIVGRHYDLVIWDDLIELAPTIVPTPVQYVESPGGLRFIGRSECR